MRTRLWLSALVGVLGCVALVPATAVAAPKVKAKMTGDQVVGQPGAPNGQGTAKLHLLRGKGKVRFQVSYKKIGGKKNLDIGVYRGKKGANGDAVFTLTDVQEASPIKGVVTNLPTKTLKQISRNPNQYNVAVKNKAYPTDGAIRGQLKNQ